MPLEVYYKKEDVDKIRDEILRLFEKNNNLMIRIKNDIKRNHLHNENFPEEDLYDPYKLYRFMKEKELKNLNSFDDFLREIMDMFDEDWS